MKNHYSARLLSLLLTLSMLFGLLVPVSAADSGKNDLKFEKVDEAVSTKLSESIIDEDEAVDVETPLVYADDEEVRVSIVLEDESTIEKFGTEDIAQNDKAIAYRSELMSEQVSMTASIEKELEEQLDVKWNLTLAANIISANIKYGQIETIQNIKGVKDVVIENRYEPMVVDKDEVADPNMSTSSIQIGSNIAWAAGYTGAGSRVAVIDTGIDPLHQSFDGAALEYSLSQLDVDVESLNLLDEEEIASVVDQLNIKADASKLYLNTKIPFAYNYIDTNYTVDHVHDDQGEHGSHVEGIAAANKYIPTDDGFANALETVQVQGVAPDAQIIVMKVFGAGGGAYDSDYMVAIEDAVILGCDSVNLSLGSGSPGFSRNGTEEYQTILDNLAESGTVVAMSAGNSSYWAASDYGVGYLYGNEVQFQMDGQPGSFTNSLAVASIDNAGFTGNFFKVGDLNVFYTETAYSNAPLTSLAGDQEYVIFAPGIAGDTTDYEGVDVAGKVVFVQRGGISFYQKAEYAANAGALACIVYNNTTGTINMDLSDYTKTAPCVSITMADGLAIWNDSEVITEGVLAGGTMTMLESIGSAISDNPYTMSSFSSWGTPGSLELKPEITAPGGSIYSVYGANNDTGLTAHDQYEQMSGTSMASPQVAGMAAVLAQYIRDNDLTTKTGLAQRQLINSLLMSTATPVVEADSGSYYSLLNQGAGLANVGDAVNAESYVLMKDNLSGTASDGKVKAELGDDPEREGVYTVEFSVNNMTDEATEYTFYTEMFTQYMFAYNNTLYLDTWTTPLSVNVTYTVDGEEFVPTAKGFECDLNEDGVTNADDAQVIANYVSEKIEYIDEELADLDNDGKITSYDAYLLLSNVTLASVEIAANDSIDVVATISLTDAQKEYLDTYYETGAYVEGYVFVETANTEDGATVPAHSIPVLAFYGNWSDPNMLDTSTYIEKLYGDTRAPHTGVTATNYLSITYPGDKNAYAYTINPYVVEDEIPYERAAISSGTSISKYTFSLERNAAAIATFVRDAEGNVIKLGSVQNQINSAYYYTNGSAWRSTAYNLNANVKLSTLGVSEGDVLTAGIAFIPEYYEDGIFDAESVKALIESDVLGEGSVLEYTFVVDDTAPELVSVQKDLMTGAVTVLAQDNNYVSSIQILKGVGSKLIAGGLPSQTEAGQVCGGTFAVDDTAGEYIKVVITDYAGNESVYKVYYGGTPEDFSGRMFGFTSGTTIGNGQRWVEIDVDNLHSPSSKVVDGMTDVEEVNYEVYAADYIGKYVFFSTLDGLYVAPQESYSEVEVVASYGGVFESDEYVADIAFNVENKTLYLLTNHLSDTSRGTIASVGNALYTVDYVTGEIVKVADITVDHPTLASTSTSAVLRTLAIDNDGNFYSANNATSTAGRIFTWTVDDIVDGEVTVAPISASGLFASGYYGTSYCSMAYDHDKEILYLAGGYGAKGSTDVDNELWVVDTTTGKTSKPNSNNAQFRDHVVGIYVVPTSSITMPKNADVTSVTLNATELELLKGSTISLEAVVHPWLAEDKSVTWSSSDASVVSVDNGSITTLKVGTATITATSVADTTKSATCEVTVTEFDNVKLSGVIYGNDSKAYWSEFETDNTEAWTAVAGASSYVGGTLHNGKLYVHDGSAIYGVDPDTFETTNLGSIASSWIWSDAAEAPANEDGAFGRMIGLCNNGGFIEMLDCEEGTLGYWDFSEDFIDDPMAVIAYSGSGTYYYSTIDLSTWTFISGDFPANFYYMMTEGGDLYQYVVLTYDKGLTYTLVSNKIGNTGLSLTDVSGVTAGAYASMAYDQTTGYLLLSVYTDGETAKLYAISPEDLIPAEIGTFGENVWPVVSLYQYARATDLTVKCDVKSISIYEADEFTVPVKVILGETNELTWSSSDNSVATVADGVVTGVAEGSAVITATTVDVNNAGEHVSINIPVSVKGLVDVDATVNAQVTIGEEIQWASIDLDTMAVTKLADAETELYGGGYAVNYLWGSDIKDASGHIYRIDPSADFEESQGSECSTSYAVRDVADNPAVTFNLTVDEDTVYTATTFGSPLYISMADGLYELVDYEGGSLSGWRATSNYADLAGITYVGDLSLGVVNTMLSTPIDEADADTICHVYYVLSSNGNVFQFITVPTYDVTADAGEEVSATLVRGKLGTLDMTFSDTNALSIDYIETEDGRYGLIISDATNGAIYFADLSGDTLTCGKVGNVAGATNITALYNASANVSTASIADSVDVAFAEKLEVVETSDVSTYTVPAEYGVAAVADIDGVDAKVEEEVAAVSMTGTASISTPLTTEKAANGSLNSASTFSVKDSEADADEHVLTVQVKEDVAVTNGKYVITYNPDEVEFVNATSSAKIKAFNVDEENGKITFVFASAEAIEAGNVLANITFEYGKYVNTEITITVEERNDDTNVGEEDVIVGVEDEVGEHEWEEIDREDATCTEDGYVTYECSNCGETKTEVIKAHGHEFITDKGYAGLTRSKTYCKNCGLVISGDSPIPVLNPVTSPILNPSKPSTKPVTEPKEDKVVEEEPVIEEEPILDNTSKELPFIDVTTEDWFYTAVEYLYNEGIMNGTSEDEFSPDVELNRATVVTILYRLEGSPAVSSNGTFSDVEDGEWYTDAVEWAASVGIVNGYEDGTFAPKKAVTREALSAILRRYAETKGVIIYETTNALSTEAVVSDWAKADVEWAVSEGLLADGESVNASANANRAEVAAAIYTFIVKTLG